MEESFGRKRKGVFYGWWIVAVSAFFNLIVGGTFMYGFTAFFTPLQQEFGWTSAQTALGFSLQRLEGGIAAPLIGFIFDRVGPRKLALIGMAIAGGGLIFMSRIESLPAFYAAFLMTAVGVSIGWAGPPMYAVSNWFVRKRSRALSYLMAGVHLGGIIVPVLVLLIAGLGWRTSLVIAGITFWLVGIPVTIMLRRRPEDMNLLPDGDVRTEADRIRETETLQTEMRVTTQTRQSADFSALDALSSRAFWFIAFSFTLVQLVSSAIMVLEMPHLENIGISRELAGVAVTFTTMMGFVGSLSSGFVGDRMNKTRIIAFFLMLQCLGVVILSLANQPWHLVPFVIAYGIANGAVMPMRTALIADYFGRKSLGTILGFMMSFTVTGSILSPVVAGWFFDIYGNYRTIFIIYAVMMAFAVPALLAVKRPVLKSELPAPTMPDKTGS
ncbi:MAG: MFS transporter [Chloroflexota bacterium]